MGDIQQDYIEASDAAFAEHQREQDEPPPPEEEPRGKSAIERVKRAAAAESPLITLLRTRAPSMRRVLPPWMPYERFYLLVHRAMGSYSLQNWRRPEQVVAAAYEAACLGLEPNTILHQCALIPYRGNKPTVLCQVEYRGYVFLAAQSGITAVAEAICERDEFEYQDGSEPYLRHRKPLRGGRGEPYAAFAMFTLPDGRRIWRVCDEDRIKRARENSGAWKKAEAEGTGDSPWHTDPAAMAAKTAIQDASRFIPHAPHMQRAAMVEQAKEAGEPVRHEPLDVREQQAEQGVEG